MGAGCAGGGGGGGGPLFAAIDAGDDAKVRSILRSTKMPSAYNSAGDTPLHHTARIAGDMSLCAEALVTSSAMKIDIPNKAGQTAVQIAAECGNSEVMNTLVKYAASCKAKDPSGQTAFHLAAKHKHPGCIASAINVGASALLTNESGQIPLHLAAAGGDVATVEALLKSRETDASLKHQGGGQTPLHEAAAAGHKDVVELLLKAGADSQVQSASGAQTPAQVARSAGHEALAVKLGAAVKEEDILAGKAAVSGGGGGYAEGDPEGLIPASNDTRKRVQQLMDETWKGTTTRDRGFSKVAHFEVVQVLQNGKKALFEEYKKQRADMELHLVNKLEDVKTVLDSWEAGLEEPRLLTANEFFLFHGTKPTAATAICEGGFRVDLSGSNKGALYGPGVYLAESSAKADEYAMDDSEGLYKGLYAMLLCRVALGNPHVTEEVQPDLPALASALEANDKHCIIGDREAARGTFREFIVRAPGRAYPAYVIIYRRQEDGEVKDTIDTNEASGLVVEGVVADS